jgi:hypothetical protein
MNIAPLPQLSSLICYATGYRPPNYNAVDNNAFLDNLQSSLDNIYLKPDTFVLLLGDFNAHYDTANPSLSSVFGTRFYSWMACNNLFQVINEPTRITSEGATRLDLIITNSPGYFVFWYSKPTKQL